MSKIIVVDKDDNEIGVKERSEITHNDVYRVSGLWLTNSKGEILLAQRSFNKPKANDPGKWGPAVAGTVDEGETYEDNIQKEIVEELGITNITLKKHPKEYRDTGIRKYFVQIYEGESNLKAEEFQIQKDEVEQVKWFPRDELKKLYKEHPEDFISTMRQIFKLFGLLS